MTESKPQKNKIQLVWGIALVIVGIAVLVKVWLVMPQLNQLQESSSVLGIMRIAGICIIAFILIGGGLRKIWGYTQDDRSDPR